YPPAQRVTPFFEFDRAAIAQIPVSHEFLEMCHILRICRPGVWQIPYRRDVVVEQCANHARSQMLSGSAQSSPKKFWDKHRALIAEMRVGLPDAALKHNPGSRHIHYGAGIEGGSDL